MAKKTVVADLPAPTVHRVRANALGFYGPASDKDGLKHQLYEAGAVFDMEIYAGHEPTWVDILDEET